MFVCFAILPAHYRMNTKKAFEPFTSAYQITYSKLLVLDIQILFLIVCLHWKAEPNLHLHDMLPDRNTWPTGE